MNVDIAAHPCFAQTSRPNSGRIHLPVSPACNIRCRFCARGISPDAALPGNAARVVSPEQALVILERALKICPAIRVVGVAGPGDPLATDHAIRTFALIHERHPELINCVSTNGLELPRRLPQLVECGIRTLTVTVNAVDSEIQARLCAGVVRDGRVIEGVAGARLLIAAQGSGIILAHSLGVTVKVNMVLVPGINDAHVEAVARSASEWGASFINIIPLLPAAEFSAFEKPACAAVEAARAVAERYLPVFRHCKQCRADACGIPGVSDHAQELYADFKLVETFSHG